MLPLLNSVLAWLGILLGVTAGMTDTKTEQDQPCKVTSLDFDLGKPRLKRALQCLGGLGTLALVLAVAPCASGIITVTNLNDSGPGSLRQAIVDATPAETIDFAVTGKITRTSGELVINKDLTLIGPGATNLTVSGTWRKAQGE
jgi:hypothetical protein